MEGIKLVYFQIGLNPIGDEGVEAILNAAKKNFNIKFLGLEVSKYAWLILVCDFDILAFEFVIDSLIFIRATLFGLFCVTS